VSDSREPSYYEVALTQRQVLVAFLVLLACLVAAFLSGVWVGRPGVGERAGSEPGTAVASLPPAGAETPTGEEADLPQLDYFAPDEEGADGVEGGGSGGGGPEAEEAEEPEGGEAPAGASGPDPSPRPGTTLAEDLGRGGDLGADDRSGGPPAAARPPAPAGPAVPKWRQRRDAAEEIKALEREFDEKAAEADRLQAGTAGGEAAPAGKRPTPPPPGSRPAEPDPPATRPGAGGVSAGAPVFVIQVISSRDQAKAREILSSLQDGGYPASLSILERPNGTWYRVRVGPYSDRSTTDKVADDVRRKYRLDTWITSE